MKFPRRNFLHMAAGAAASLAASRLAWAQTYPMRPVRIVVATAAGGSPDILARLIGQWLSERLGQPFVIENRPGGGNNIGTEAVARASPDGHTILLVQTANAISTALYDNLSFNFMRDIIPVAGIFRGPYVMVVHPSVPAHSIPEFIAYAKSNPGKINIASPGIGTGPHMAGELFKMMAGVNMVHVPYRGAPPALNDLFGGQVHAYFAIPVVVIDHIRAGKLRALAVTTTARSDALPDVPTFAEFLPDYEASAWLGFGVPKGTSAEIVEKLNRETNACLSDPGIKARLADLGGTVLPGSPSDFGQLIAKETEKWGKVIKFAGIKAK
jgi:tripartite-type tricarboxylate transporter receptor subunit TctC